MSAPLHRRGRGRAGGRAAAAAVACGLVLAACSGGAPPETTTKPPPSTTLPQGANPDLVPQLLEKLALGRSATFAARYDFTGANDRIPQGTYALAQDPPRRKVELVGNGKGVAFYGSGDETVACAAQGGAWTCVQTSGKTQNVPLSYEVLFNIADQFRPAQYYYDFSQSDRKIAGVTAWCLEAKATDKIPPEVAKRVGTAATICVAPNGAPLVVQTQGSTAPLSISATNFTTKVPADAFNPPADVQPGLQGVVIPDPPTSK